FVVLGQLDVILDLLVRRDPPDEKKVHQLVVESAIEGRPAGATRHARDVDRQRQDPGRLEPNRRELLSVVFGHAQRKVDAADEPGELFSSEEREPEQAWIVRR